MKIICGCGKCLLPIFIRRWNNSDGVMGEYGSGNKFPLLKQGIDPIAIEIKQSVVSTR